MILFLFFIILIVVQKNKEHKLYDYRKTVLAVVSFHPDILPPQYVLALATSRVTVPANAFLEATLMEIVAEMLRKASIRLPKQIGPAIGIVGTIVIGQAAVGVGLVRPLMAIIISLATMSSFASPDYTIMNPICLLKFVLLIITGGFELFGFMMGFILITVHLISLTNFGVPYITPIAPLDFKDLKGYLLSDITLSKKRPEFLNTRDKTRQ
ncbi:spore germination protein [Clostridiaceae bacterium 35-E11]